MERKRRNHSSFSGGRVGLPAKIRRVKRAGPGRQQLTIKSATSLVFLWWADEMIIIFFGVKDEDL